MNRHAIILALGLSAFSLQAQDTSYKPVDLNTPRQFPAIQSAEVWKKRAEFIREHARAVCGLLPMPLKMPLNAKVFDKVERDGYSIEKVYFETHPGFYLAGNLYRPLGKGAGPFPAVLNPHGHWNNGRMADTELGSIAGRCISQARQGIIAFTYDMVGYNDTRQVDHKFGNKPENQLWNISLLGLQTWNSIRALDFLESLPDVNPEKLSCTGESGGGTQTFMLGAVDNRLYAQAPIVMVSHMMQGGCLCENAPGLRVDHSNMEIAAAVAPRPQIIVSATGDWTRNTMTVEGPGIASAYRLLGAEDKFRYAIFDYDHNYNQTTREAVYGFFQQYLNGGGEVARVAELAFKKEPDEALKVFPDKLPDNALTEEQFTKWLIEQYKSQTAQQVPYDEHSLKQWKDLTTRLWSHSLVGDQSISKKVYSVGENVESKSFSVTTPFSKKAGGFEKRAARLMREGEERPLSVTLLSPKGKESKVVAMLIHPDGEAAYLKDGEPSGLAKSLLAEGTSVLLVETFQTVGKAGADLSNQRKYFDNYFTTYNRTDIQERVGDIITAANWVRMIRTNSKLALVGEGRAGLWVMLAAPVGDLVVADADQFDDTKDESLLAQDLFVPGLRRIGGFANIAALAYPKPVTIHNVNSGFDTSAITAVYKSAKAASKLKIQADKLKNVSFSGL